MVAAKYDVAPSYVSYLMQRAFTMDEFGNFFLTRALVPGKRLMKPKRNIALSTKRKRRNDKYSLAVVFEKHPEFKQELYELVKAFVERKKYALNWSYQREVDTRLGALLIVLLFVLLWAKVAIRGMSPNVVIKQLDVLKHFRIRVS